MSKSSENRFIDELKSAEKRLKASGRPAEFAGMINSEGMLKDNMRLPYSTFPELMGSRWKKAKIIPD